MDTEKTTKEQALAALHEAGHFVLCWLIGFPPMTVNVTARGTGKVDFRSAVNATPKEWRICLMGGYAAETLKLKSELFLLATDGTTRANEQGYLFHCANFCSVTVSQHTATAGGRKVTLRLARLILNCHVAYNIMFTNFVKKMS